MSATNRIVVCDNIGGGMFPPSLPEPRCARCGDSLPCAEHPPKVRRRGTRNVGPRKPFWWCDGGAASFRSGYNFEFPGEACGGPAPVDEDGCCKWCGADAIVLYGKRKMRRMAKGAIPMDYRTGLVP